MTTTGTNQRQSVPQYRQSSENSKNSPRISATLGVVILPYLSRALIYKS
ncbi:hypothetical protein HMPREF9564_00545 [Cutibacterium acnes HL053PA1]|nr:hypothetical protein HMPREF9616_01070 [Cutibacterium acnes HL007PA1]EFT18892.1 hypothetical protein HMPREF9564_00545 [Cutibacterium acnes HL053PA1]EFT21971.1 hypothetical protein HMPREF9566_00079 [Cutibacterium acnes HL045PA1]